MLQSAYFLAKIGADTAENEQNFAEKLPKIGNYLAAAGEQRYLYPGLGELLGRRHVGPGPGPRAARVERAAVPQ